MIDELEIVRRAFDAPAHDPEAKERALARLREAMAPARPTRNAVPRRRRAMHPVRWLGIAAAVVAIVLVAQSVFWRHDTAPAALRHLSDVAATQPAVQIPPGGYLAMTIQESYLSEDGSGAIGNLDISTGQGFDLVVRYTAETRLRSDGTGERVTTIDKVSFPTDHDHDAWVEAGMPHKIDAGDTDRESLQGDRIPGYDVSTLPVDPARLEAALRPVPNGMREDEEVMEVAANLLAESNPSPELRAALFEVLADLPGIKLLGQVTDPLGRSGTGILIPRGPSNEELIFDPSTSAVLATLDFAASGGPARSWRAITNSTVTKKSI